MPQFGPASLQKLATCDERLQRVFEKVVQDFDCSVIEGHRDQAAQDKAFAEGHSKLKWPNGNHNALPSRAVDVAPYPIDWNDAQRMHLFAGFVIATGLSLGVKLRWGGDWDGDRQVKDETFRDLVHFEVHG